MDGQHELPAPVRIARDMASEDWGVPVSEITVEHVEAVDWPDASLGAPEPDTFYAQMITPGYRIRLRAGRRSRTCHADRHSRVVVVDDQPSRD
jgi:hypothetical protein